MSSTLDRALDKMPDAAQVTHSESDTSAGRLNQMLGSGSSLMKRAATQGRQQAQQRGLLNSSMAAGAAQGAMIDRAQPFAMQDSNNLMQTDRQNTDATNQRRLLQSQLLGESAMADQNYQQQRGLNTQQGELDMERLGATSAANAWGVMSNNVTDIVAQGMEGIANINANPDISQADKTKMISQITKMRDTDIDFQRGLYDNMSGFFKDSGLFPNL
ncbi:MAG: hypothetical protein ACLFSR_10490 [Halomonas sp.]